MTRRTITLLYNFFLVFESKTRSQRQVGLVAPKTANLTNIYSLGSPAATVPMSSQTKTRKPSSTRGTKGPSFLDDLAFSFATPEERKKIAEKRRVARREANGERKLGEKKHREGKHEETKMHRVESKIRYSHEELTEEGPAGRVREGMSERGRREYRIGGKQWNSKELEGHVSVDAKNMKAYATSATGEKTEEESRNPFLRWVDEKLSHLELSKGEAGMIRELKVADTPYNEWAKEQESGGGVVEISVAGSRSFTSEGGSRRSKNTGSTQTGNSLSPSWLTRCYTPPAPKSRGHARSRTMRGSSSRSSRSGSSGRSMKSRYEEKKNMDGQVAHIILDTEPDLRYCDPDAITPRKPKAGSGPSEWFMGGGTVLTGENLKIHTAAGGGQRGYQAKSMVWAAECARRGEGGDDASDGGSEVSLWEGDGDDDLEPKDSISVAWMKAGYWDRRQW